MPKRSKSSSAKRSVSRKLWFYPALVAILLAAIGLLAWYWHNHNSTVKIANTSGSNTSVTPAPPTKNAKRNSSSPSSTVNQGGAIDKNGQKPSSVSDNSSQWTSSASGLITLKSPIESSVLKNGDAIYGSASSGPVQFRLIDSSVGVIAQGTLNVVDGSFSGTASFKPYGSSGRLDVFNTDSSGKEVNELQVQVNF
jgi:hypothetical protein